MAGGGEGEGGGRNQFNYVDTETVNINTFSSPSHADMFNDHYRAWCVQSPQPRRVACMGRSVAAVGHTGHTGQTLRHHQHQHHLAHGPGQGAGARDTAEMRPMVTAIHQQESGHETTVKTSACSQLELSTEPFTVPGEDPY